MNDNNQNQDPNQYIFDCIEYLDNNLFNDDEEIKSNKSKIKDNSIENSNQLLSKKRKDINQTNKQESIINNNSLSKLSNTKNNGDKINKNININTNNTTYSIEKGQFVDDLEYLNKKEIEENVYFDKHGVYQVKENEMKLKNYQFADLKDWQKEYYWDELVNMANKHIFRFKHFRSNQREIINAMLSGRDIFVNMPTGGGKSLTFQLPASICRGATIVIMPLVSLITDQIKYASKLGINCVYLKDDFFFEKNFIYKYFESNNPETQIKLIYLTPEKMFLSDSTINFIQELYSKNLIDRFVIDEVHCLSQWGKDFRPEYLNLKKLKIEYPRVPILVMTATANLEIRDEIIDFLELENCLIFRSSYNRANIFLEVREKTKFNNPLRDIAEFIQKKYPNGSGIIYCSCRKDCESISNKLRIDYGFTSDYYFSTISERKKIEVQEKFMTGEIQILVATIAFGMGINKENIRFVVHYNLPKSFENYYQEIGRAGRDGKKANAILYYNINERRTLDYLLARSGGEKQVKSSNLRKINQVVAFCEEKAECRRVMALKYFGEVFSDQKCEKMCDNCCRSIETTDIDVSSLAVTVIDFFDFLKKCTFKMTINQSSSYLKGLKLEKFKSFNFILRRDTKYFGLLKNWDLSCITKLIRTLILKHYLCEAVECYYENVCCYIEIDHLGDKFLKEKQNYSSEQGVEYQDLKIILSFQKGRIKSFGLQSTGCVEVKSSPVRENNFSNKNNSNNNSNLDESRYIKCSPSKISKQVTKQLISNITNEENTNHCNSNNNFNSKDQGKLCIELNDEINLVEEDDLLISMFNRIEEGRGIKQEDSYINLNILDKTKKKNTAKEYGTGKTLDQSSEVKEVELTNLKTPCIATDKKNGYLENITPNNLNFSKVIPGRSKEKDDTTTDRKVLKKSFFI
jgi:RecQ family ATP-dependent DNA helicase